MSVLTKERTVNPDLRLRVNQIMAEPLNDSLFPAVARTRAVGMAQLTGVEARAQRIGALSEIIKGNNRKFDIRTEEEIRKAEDFVVAPSSYVEELQGGGGGGGVQAQTVVTPQLRKERGANPDVPDFDFEPQPETREEADEVRGSASRHNYSAFEGPVVEREAASVRVIEARPQEVEEADPTVRILINNEPTYLTRTEMIANAVDMQRQVQDARVLELISRNGIDPVIETIVDRREKLAARLASGREDPATLKAALDSNEERAAQLARLGFEVPSLDTVYNPADPTREIDLRELQAFEPSARTADITTHHTISRTVQTAAVSVSIGRTFFDMA